MSEDFTIGKRKKKSRIDVFDNMGSETTTNTTSEGIPDTKQTVQDPLNTEQEEVLKSINLEDKAGQQFNPFAGNVDPRGEHANIKTDQTIKDDLKGWTPPPINFNEPQQQQPINPVNPTVNMLPPEDQRMAAERMVDFVLDMYSMVVEFAKKGIEIKRDDLVRLHAESKIDMNYMVPVDEYGNTVPFIQIIENFNTQSLSVFTVDESFKNKVREPMIRVFIKHGVGLTDEQFLMVQWGIEVLKKTVMFFQLRSTGKKLLENQILFHEQYVKGSSGQTQRPVTTKQSTPDYKEPEEANVISEDEL